MKNPNAPQTIPVRGVNIIGLVLDQEDGTQRLDLGFNLEEFYRENKMYTNAKGWLSTQIVKRKEPTPSGHTHFMRVTSSKTNVCVVDDLQPKPFNGE